MHEFFFKKTACGWLIFVFEHDLNYCSLNFACCYDFKIHLKLTFLNFFLFYVKIVDKMVEV